MSQAQRPMTPFEWGLLLLLSVLWGGSFFFVGVAVKELPPLTIVAARVSIAAALLWADGARRQASAPVSSRAQIGPLLVLGLLNNAIPFVLIVWGQTHLASGLASILNASTPVITVVAAHFLTRDERLDARKLIGALFGLTGVAAMIGPDLTYGDQAGRCSPNLRSWAPRSPMRWRAFTDGDFARRGLRPSTSRLAR